MIKPKRQSILTSETIFALLLVFLTALLIKNSRIAMEYTNRGLLLCARTMIPTLFPFMVIAELLVVSGGGERLAGVIAKPLRRLFGLSNCGVCALALGWLCGFPVGSRAAVGYYRQGRITRRELNHVICFCNVPSTAFLVSAVGVCLFGSDLVGWCLVGLSLTSAAVIGVVFRRWLPQWREDADATRLAQISTNAAQAPKRKGQLLSRSISLAATGMLNVCATIVLFSALMGSVSAVTAGLALPEILRVSLFGTLEITTGVCEASLLDSSHALSLCAAFVGWAGLSVHCQIFSSCDDAPVSVTWFWLSRLLQAMLCGGGMWLLQATGMIHASNTPQLQSAWLFSEKIWGVGGSDAWSAICIGVLLVTLLWQYRRHRLAREGGI